MNVLRIRPVVVVARRTLSTIPDTATTTAAATSSPKSPTFLPATRRRPLRSPIWKSPLRHGKVNAYDEALKYIRADAQTLRRELADLKHDFQQASADDARAGRSHDPEALQRYRDKMRVLQVQSEINLPEVRYAFKTGRFPFQRPVYRHLAEQKWRMDGTLDLLMERLYQMNIVPDLLPALHPTVDLRVQFPYLGPRTAHQRAREKGGFSTIEPGSFLTAAQTRQPPRIAATAFHDDTRLYTLLMLDPDVPDETRNSYQTYLHWIQPNIPLSASRRITRITPTSHLSYIPPHPQQGTPYHRYVLLLLPHTASPTTPLDIPVPSDAERLGFDLRAFVTQWGLDTTQGGGAHMWREEWDAGVSEVYRDVLGVPEPRFGRMPKPDPYADLKTRRRYMV